MIKQISPNIDELLLRYSQHDTVNSVNRFTSPHNPQQLPPKQDHTMDMIIGRLERLEHNKWSSKKNRPSKFNKSGSQAKYNCAHCSFVNKQLGTNFDTKHNSKTCSKKKISISVIESLENEAPDSSPTEAESSSSEGENSESRMFHSSPFLQNSNERTDPRTSFMQIDSDCSLNKANFTNYHQHSAVNDVSDNYQCCVTEDNKNILCGNDSNLSNFKQTNIFT